MIHDLDYGTKLVKDKWYTQKRFDMAKLSIEREKPRLNVRDSQLKNIDQLDARQHSQLRKRIFQNHEITSASATFESIQAAEENYASLVELAGAKQIMKDYHSEVNAIVGRMQGRMTKIEAENPKPKAPSLSTAARAERRRKRFEDKMEKQYGKHWREGEYVQSNADKIC